MTKTRHLAIVRRNQFSTFAMLAKAFADEPDVRLIWDRRVRERRRSDAPLAPGERRQSDRRRDAGETWGRSDYLLLGAIVTTEPDIPER